MQTEETMETKSNKEMIVCDWYSVPSDPVWKMTLPKGTTIFSRDCDIIVFAEPKTGKALKGRVLR